MIETTTIILTFIGGFCTAIPVMVGLGLMLTNTTTDKK